MLPLHLYTESKYQEKVETNSNAYNAEEEYETTEK